MSFDAFKNSGEGKLAVTLEAVINIKHDLQALIVSMTPEAEAGSTHIINEVCGAYSPGATEIYVNGYCCEEKMHVRVTKVSHAEFMSIMAEVADYEIRVYDSDNDSYSTRNIQPGPILAKDGHFYGLYVYYYVEGIINDRTQDWEEEPDEDFIAILAGGGCVTVEGTKWSACTTKPFVSFALVKR